MCYYISRSIIVRRADSNTFNHLQMKIHNCLFYFLYVWNVSHVTIRVRWRDCSLVPITYLSSKDRAKLVWANSKENWGKYNWRSTLTILHISSNFCFWFLSLNICMSSSSCHMILFVYYILFVVFCLPIFGRMPILILSDCTFWKNHCSNKYLWYNM